jgi:hypothetical protein
MMVAESRRPPLDSLLPGLFTALCGFIAAYGFSFIYIYYLNPPQEGSWASDTELYRDLATGFALGLGLVALVHVATATLRRKVKPGPPHDD